MPGLHLLCFYLFKMSTSRPMHEKVCQAKSKSWKQNGWTCLAGDESKEMPISALHLIDYAYRSLSTLLVLFQISGKCN